MKDLFISIVNTNNRDLLKDTILSIYKNTHRATFDIYVVDNNSTDGSAEMVKEEFPDVKLIQNRVNLGYPASHNRALRLINNKYRYALVANEDIYVKDGAIDRVIEFMDKTPDAGIVGPKLLNRDGSWQPSCQRFLSLKTLFFRALYIDKIFKNFKPFSKYYQYYPYLDRITPVDTVMGSFFIVKREVFDKIGLMDERFFIFAEETDFMFRAKKAGWKTYFYPYGEVIHYGGESTFKTRISTKMFIELHKSNLKFFDKHYGKSFVSMANNIFIIHLLLKFIGYSIISLIKPSRNNIDKRRQFKDVLLWHLKLKRQP